MGLFKKSSADKVRYRYKDRVERAEFRGKEITEVEMPDTVRIIGESGFRDCKQLTRIDLSNTLCEIGAYAFRDCTALENVLMPGEMFYPDSTHGVIGLGSFEGCTKLREIVIPEGIRVIEPNAFHNCTSLETVRFPKSLRAVRNGAFSGCEKLKAIIANSLPEIIAFDAFRGTPYEETVRQQRTPVLTVMHTSSFSLPVIFQFSAIQRLIGVEQTDGDMTVQLDAVDENRVAFRITQYKHAGGSHMVPANEPTRLFYEEYDCTGRTGMQKEEIIASYR